MYLSSARHQFKTSWWVFEDFPITKLSTCEMKMVWKLSNVPSDKIANIIMPARESVCCPRGANYQLRGKISILDFHLSSIETFVFASLKFNWDIRIWKGRRRSETPRRHLENVRIWMSLSSCHPTVTSEIFQPVFELPYQMWSLSHGILTGPQSGPTTCLTYKLSKFIKKMI